MRQNPTAITIERVLWVLMTGCQWYLWRAHHGSWQLHYYRFRKLVSLGVFKGEFEKVSNEYVAVKVCLACLLIPVDRGKSDPKMTTVILFALRFAVETNPIQPSFQKR